MSTPPPPSGGARKIEPPPGRSHRRAVWFWSLFAAGSLIFVVAFGVAFWVLVRMLISSQEPALAQRPADAETESAAGTEPLVSRFAIVRPAGGQEGGAAASPVLVSLPPDSKEAAGGSADGPHRGTLAREIVAQAFLVAAREGLGMRTRDVNLGDPGGAGAASIVIATPLRPKAPVKVTVVPVEGGPAPQVWSSEFKLRDDDDFSYRALVEAAEAFSRGIFLEALEKGGCSGRPNPPGGDAKVDDAIEKDLDVMTFTTQFAAVRSLHEAMRKRGESPELLGALVRGYANLGVMTEMLWNASSKAFKARALVYSQRLAARDPKAAWGSWHRAYALALTGLHADALDELAASRKLVEALGKDAPRPPEWLGLIDKLCRFDTAGLDAFKGSRFVPLAQLFRFLTVDGSTGFSTHATEAGWDVLRTDPECFRVIEGLCAISGVSHQHKATLVGPAVLKESLPRRLSGMKGLPDDVSALVKKGATARELAAALEGPGASAGDSGEPSWGVLGRMAREVQFTQVWRRADFLQGPLSVPVDEFLAEAGPSIAGHPYRSFVEMYGLDPAGRQEAMDGLLRNLNPAELELTEIPIAKFSQHSLIRAQQVYDLMLRHADDIYRDLELINRNFNVPNRSVGSIRDRKVEQFFAVSPHAPLAASLRIVQEFVGVEPLAKEWEEAYAQHPQVLFRLSELHRRRGRGADADRCIQKAVKVSRDPYLIQRLAQVYRNRGDLAKWKETLDEYLKTADHTLEYAGIQVDIATYLMSQKDFEQALPYVESALECGANWAMLAAVDCYEGLGQFDKAEFWIAHMTERYPRTGWNSWAVWCASRGKGHLKEAAAMAIEYVDAVGDRLPDDDQGIALAVFVMAKEYKKGVDYLSRRFPRPSHGMEGLYLALYADELGDLALREDALTRIPADDREIVEFAAVLRAGLPVKGKNKGKGAIDPKAIDLILKRVAPARGGELSYFAGHFLARHGRKEDAVRYLQQAGEAPEIKKRYCGMAAIDLRELGVEPGAWAASPEVPNTAAEAK